MKIKKSFIFLNFQFFVLLGVSVSLFAMASRDIPPSPEQVKIMQDIKKSGNPRECFKNKKISRFVLKCIVDIAIQKNDIAVCEKVSNLNMVGACVGSIARKRKNSKLCTEVFKYFPDTKKHCEMSFKDVKPF